MNGSASNTATIHRFFCTIFLVFLGLLGHYGSGRESKSNHIPKIREVTTMIDLVKKGLSFGLGLAVTSKEQAEKLVNDWVQKGELTKEESKEMIRRLTERGEEEKNKLKAIVREQLQQLLSELDVATKEDIRRLEQRIENLNQRSE